MKSIFLLTLCLLKQVWAEEVGAALTARQLENEFWAVMPGQSFLQKPLAMTLSSPDVRLASDCREYELAVAEVTSADELKWRRSQPLPGDMKNSYEVSFKVAPLPAIQMEAVEKVSGQILTPHLVLEHFPQAPKVKPELTDAAWLMLASEQFQLPSPSLQLRQGGHNWWLDIRERDLACDLLAGRARIRMSANGNISLSADDILKLNRFFNPIEEKTQSILLDTDTSPGEQAAELGLFYGEMCERMRPASEVTGCIRNLFAVLFEAGSLQHSSAWQKLGEEVVIVVPKSIAVSEIQLTISTVDAPVLGAGQRSEYENELQKTEADLASLKAIPFERLTERQRTRHSELVQRRAAYIKRKIFDKYGRYL